MGQTAHGRADGRLSAVMSAVPVVLIEVLVAKLPEILQNLDKLLTAIFKAVNWLSEKLRQGLQYAADKLKEVLVWFNSKFSSSQAEPERKLHVPESRVSENAPSRLEHALGKMGAKKSGVTAADARVAQKLAEMTHNFVEGVDNVLEDLDEDNPSKAEVKGLTKEVRTCLADIKPKVRKL